MPKVTRLRDTAEEAGIGLLFLLYVAFYPAFRAWSWIRRFEDERACTRARRRRKPGGMWRVGDQLLTDQGPFDWTQVEEARWYEVVVARAFAQDDYEVLLAVRMRDGREEAYWATGVLREGDDWPGLPVREGERVSSQGLYWFLFSMFWAIPLFVLGVVYG